MKKTLISLLLFATILTIKAQDTIRVMHYNLLYYGATYDDCTTITNPVEQKEQYLRTIANYYKPDILSCNELGKTADISDRLLDSVFNYNGNNTYARTPISNISNSNLITMLYYNQNKLGLSSQTALATDYRDFVFNKLYYKAPDLSTWGDTAFIICISTHLKAGETTQDASDRKAMVDILMNYLNTLNVKDNYILMGDFNVYGASEACFQTLINHSNPNIRFYDPVNQIGEWHDNQAYKFYHTQSTRTSGNGCPSTGGMDDRFDFIMASSQLLNGPYKYVKYIPNSYKIPGQDGQRFNGSLISPANYSAPSNIINAMYNLSDHIPVMMDLQAGLNVGIENYSSNDHLVTLNAQNPVINKQINLQAYSEKETEISLNILSITGAKLSETKVILKKGTNHINIPVDNLTRGLYLLNVSGNNKYGNTIRIVIP